MKNILVTGASGFIGTSLVKRLRADGFNVFEFDTHIGDIAIENILEPFAKFNIDHVIHLAARSFVPDSWNNPFEFYQTNVMGTTNVLEFCRKNNCGLTMISSYVYGTPDYLPIDEKHPLKSYNPYSHTKLMCESLCEFYTKNFNQKITIIRPFNAYGPGQSTSFLIPEIIKKAYHEEVVEVMDLTPKRDYIYIEDIVDALVLTLNSAEGIYNIGSGYSISVEDIVKTIINVMGNNKKYISKQSSRKNEVFDVVANIDRAKANLNWAPKTSFELGIKNCIESYINSLNG